MAVRPETPHEDLVGGSGGEAGIWAPAIPSA